MDTSDSTLNDTPLLDEPVGVSEQPLGDLEQIAADPDPAPGLGDLSELEESDTLPAADEAIPVLSELVSPPPPSEVSSHLDEPQSTLDAANQPQDALSTALDDLLGENDAIPELAPEPPPVQATDDQPEPPTLTETSEPATLLADETRAIEPEADPAPSTRVQPEAGQPERSEEDSAPPSENTVTEADEGTTLEDTLDALLGEGPEAGDETSGGFTVSEEAPAAEREEEPAAAPDNDLAGIAPEDNDTPLDTLAPAAAATAAAGALPQLRHRLEAHLSQRMDEVLHETVTLLVQELEQQIAQRVENVLMETLEEALPRLMSQFTEGLRAEIQPRLHEQIPRLMAEILDSGEKQR